MTYNKVKNFIEIESNSECKLITLQEDYVDTQSKIEIQCRCGNKFETTFSEFKSKNKRQCNKCGFYLRGDSRRLSRDEVESILNPLGIFLLEEYKSSDTLHKFQCSKGHIFTKRFHDIQSGSLCPYCSFDEGFRNYKYTYEEVEQFVESIGYELLSKKYMNNYIDLTIKCDKGHVFTMPFKDLKNSGHRCPICHKENIFNPYKDLKLYLRTKINQWKIDSMKNCNYKCVITNSQFDDIHHLYSFHKIVEESLKELKLPIKPIGDYSSEELKLIEEKNLELHYKYGLGVCLSRYWHRKFHHKYGWDNNTSNQFQEFKLNIMEEIKNENI